MKPRDEWGDPIDPSQLELPDDTDRIDQGPRWRMRVPGRVRVDEYGFDRAGGWWPERDGAVDSNG